MGSISRKSRMAEKTAIAPGLLLLLITYTFTGGAAALSTILESPTPTPSVSLLVAADSSPSLTAISMETTPFTPNSAPTTALPTTPTTTPTTALPTFSLHADDIATSPLSSASSVIAGGGYVSSVRSNVLPSASTIPPSTASPVTTPGVTIHPAADSTSPSPTTLFPNSSPTTLLTGPSPTTSPTTSPITPLYTTSPTTSSTVLLPATPPSVSSTALLPATTPSASSTNPSPTTLIISSSPTALIISSSPTTSPSASSTNPSPTTLISSSPATTPSASSTNPSPTTSIISSSPITLIISSSPTTSPSASSTNPSPTTLISSSPTTTPSASSTNPSPTTSIISSSPITLIISSSPTTLIISSSPTTHSSTSSTNPSPTTSPSASSTDPSLTPLFTSSSLTSLLPDPSTTTSPTTPPIVTLSLQDYLAILVGGVTGIVVVVMVLTLCILVFCIVTMTRTGGRYTVRQKGSPRRRRRTEAYRPPLNGLGIGTLSDALVLSAAEEGTAAVHYDSIRRTNGQSRISQQSSLYATVGPPRHQPVTTVTSLGDADIMRLSGEYDMPMDLHLDVGVAVGRDSNVYEVPHDVLDDLSQLYVSRSSSGYDTVTRIRAGFAGQGTRPSYAHPMSPSLLMDLEETDGADDLVARGYETPQSAQERYSRELEELALGDSEEDDSSGYERPVDIRSALSLSALSDGGHSASPYEVARQPSEVCGRTTDYYTATEQSEGEGQEEEEEEDTDTDEYFWQPPDTEEELYATLDRKRYSFIPQERVRTLSKIGEGHFASVFLGSWLSGKGRFTQVAVKRLKPTASAEWRVKFLQEAAIMGQFHHQNIVRMFGVVQVMGEEDDCAILLEYLPKGDLQHHLLDVKNCVRHHQKDPHAVALALLDNAQQIASGMNYLANKEFVHRDLAARNILLDADYVCKIGDFGMSRDLSDKGYYRATGGQVPIKWTAPEAMAYKKFTSASDVWSYGCLLYEMWSLGGRPLPGVKLEQTYRELMAGYRSPPPPGCTRRIYKLMMDCWHPDPSRRPKFSEIHSLLHTQGEELLASEEGSEVGEEEPTPTTTDLATSHVQWQLGGILEGDSNMFLDLQTIYRDSQS